MQITDQKTIFELSEKIARDFQPERIILFGSYAYGNPTPDSDVDLLIILPFEGKSEEKAVEIRINIKPPFPVDIIVRTPEKVKERIDLGDDFMLEILKKGKVLYEKNHTRMGRKSGGDFVMMERESRARNNPNYDGICFHAQQCAEKYLKARLHESGIEVIKTHDLVSLLDKVIQIEPIWEIFRKDLAFLSQFAVNFRYPGDAASRETALLARSHCRKFRLAARKSLRLE